MQGVAAVLRVCGCAECDGQPGGRKTGRAAAVGGAVAKAVHPYDKNAATPATTPPCIFLSLMLPAAAHLLPTSTCIAPAPRRLLAWRRGQCHADPRVRHGLGDAGAAGGVQAAQGGRGGRAGVGWGGGGLGGCGARACLGWGPQGKGGTGRWMGTGAGAEGRGG